MKAVILAAGYATRLGALTANRPKALLPLGGRTILDLLVDELCTVPAVDEIHLVSNHRFADQFHAWADERRANCTEGRQVPIVIWDDGTTSNADRLGALGDVQFVLEHADIHDDLFVGVSDNLFTFPLRSFYDAYAENPRNLLLVTRIPDYDTRKRLAIATTDENGRVVHLVEKPQAPESDLGVYGLYFYPAETVPLFAQYLAEGNPPDAPGHFPEWLYSRRPVYAWAFEGECDDIGTPESYAALCARYEKKN